MPASKSSSKSRKRSPGEPRLPAAIDAPARRDNRSRDDWIREALRVLGEEGHGSVTPARLATRLGVTRGSFYHHFGSVDAFIDAVVARWEAEGIEPGFRDAAAAGPDARAQLAHMMRFVWTRSHYLELAMRAWALANPRVAMHLERIDRDRLARLVTLFTALTGDAARARFYAEALLFGFIGCLCSFPPPTGADLRRRAADLERLLPDLAVR